MRHTNYVTALLVLLLVPAAFAGDSSHEVTFTRTVAVNGTDVRPGDYKVKWQGTGDMLNLSVTNGKHVLATSPAHRVALDNAPSKDMVFYRQNANGTQSVSELRFGGKKFAIVLGEQDANASMASHSAGSTANK